MKLLSIAVPCYNSQDYMNHCIDTLLTGGDDVEILIVDDGSKDDTAKIADEYEKKYPGIVRAIHQENGGHGAAVMTGVHNAQGVYFKVVDSDDWVDTDAFAQILATLRELVETDRAVDLFVSNYIYDKVGAKHKRVMRYANAIPEKKVITWDDVGVFHKGQYILMHSVIYRTQVLRDCGLDLPRHTFYVDNLFVYVPLPYVKTLYYLDVVFYHYFIGRGDQSVQEDVMIRRIDQQIKVNKLMAQQVDLKKVENKRLRGYMFNYLEIITVISSILCLRSGIEENFRKKQELWEFLEQNDAQIYRKLRRGIMGRVMNLPGKLGRGIAVTAYKITQRTVGFNRVRMHRKRAAEPKFRRPFLAHIRIRTGTRAFLSSERPRNAALPRRS